MKMNKGMLVVVGLAALAGCAGKQAVKPSGSSATASRSGTQASGAGQSSSAQGSSMASTSSPTLSSFSHMVHFRTNSSASIGVNRQIVKENASYLEAHPSVRVRLEGNTDERGTAQYNMALGWRRADAVKHMLEVLGVSGSQLATISFGKSRPLALGHNPKAWAVNRRVYFNYKYFASK
ncbi:OmpA family protein [Acidiferrobacter sp.]|uniref:OmpA family protein n=1 Tax=Acidiferrobacter sp. TaxID=1872107 RepID=UPI00261079D1|nr:OmpA family protein [Acidiferrobacter sp.]